MSAAWLEEGLGRIRRGVRKTLTSNWNVASRYSCELLMTEHLVWRRGRNGVDGVWGRVACRRW
jgi:hypothetical protein